MSRFQILIKQIQNQQTDDEGEKGKWIKAVKHSKEYDNAHSQHPDTQ